MSNLYISTYLAPYRIDFCNALAERLGCKIYHYVPAENEDGMLQRAVFENNRLETGSFAGKTYATGLRKLLSDNRPEIVFSQEYSLITLKLMQLRKQFGYKLVAICDDSMDMIGGNDFSATHTLARKIVPRYLDNIILHSPDVLEWYRERFGKGVLMPIIADDALMRERLAASVPDSSRIVGEYGLEGKKIILFVGRLVGLKNIPRLIEAYAAVRDRARLVIVGYGPERASLEALSASLGLDVIFTGALFGNDLLAWYNIADVLALPSTQEAFGAVTGEALTCGCRVMVSSRAGSASLVREGENGLVVDPCKVESMSQALATLLDMPVLQRSPGGIRPSLLPVEFASALDGLLKHLI